MNNDFKHINCHAVLVAADALTPDQLQRKRESKWSVLYHCEDCRKNSIVILQTASKLESNREFDH